MRPSPTCRRVSARCSAPARSSRRARAAPPPPTRRAPSSRRRRRRRSRAMPVDSRMEEGFRLGPDHVLLRVQRGAALVALPALAIALAGAIFQPEAFFRAYLVSYLFYFGIALGSMAILMVQYVTGGAWGAVVRRVLESGTRTLPLME